VNVGLLRLNIWVTLQDFPHPKTLDILRGFLGNKIYYRKFVKKYGNILASLTPLPKRNAFVWGEVTT
jgi:hypothetical protein